MHCSVCHHSSIHSIHYHRNFLSLHPGWRLRSYPLEIYAGDELIWRGETEKSLGYIHLNVKPVLTNEITIRLKGASKEGDGFGQIVEVAAPAAGELDLFKAKNGDKTNHELRIVEIEFKENLWQ